MASCVVGVDTGASPDFLSHVNSSGSSELLTLGLDCNDADCGRFEADVVIAGIQHRAHYFVMTLPHSDACFVCAYPGATTEAWLDGHNRAFSFFGGIPKSILYDNDKVLVARILPDGTRQRTRAFSGLQSHYLFEDRYGRPGKGNDKGNVEGIVGFARRNFMVPVPRFDSWEAFNAYLEKQCRHRQRDVLRGHRKSIGERLVRDQEVLVDLPPVLFDACDRQATRVSSLSLVRYRNNDYSVPVAFGHQEVWIRGYVHEVIIGCGVEIIACHPRSYDREDLIFNPIHYLPLLEKKIGALDQAAPLMGWDLPDVFASLRRLLEARMGKPGKREYVQVLRLLETFELNDLHGAIGQPRVRVAAAFADSPIEMSVVADLREFREITQTLRVGLRRCSFAREIEFCLRAERRCDAKRDSLVRAALEMLRETQKLSECALGGDGFRVENKGEVERAGSRGKGKRPRHLPKRNGGVSRFLPRPPRKKSWIHQWSTAPAF